MIVFCQSKEIHSKALKLLPEQGTCSLFVSVQGIVQGVGFRPFVYRCALKHALKGEVSNNAQGVEIKISGTRESLLSFILELQNSPPPLSVIREARLESMDYTDYSDFRIKESEKGNAYQIDITPDIATCQACLHEMNDKNDYRYQYPFINCTDCGPRYSIIQDLPYDRKMTTMQHFELCPQCSKEYHDPGNRRFHAQPVACPECGPHLELLDFAGKIVVGATSQNAIQKACELIQRGNILAIKGLGGFHLACRADLDSIIRSLRQRKKRDEKPFAIMVKDVSVAEKIAFFSPQEKAILQSMARPIVLVQKKRNVSAISELVAPKLPSLGIMLPYTPLHHLLFDTGYFDALVMTSANVSDEPMIYQNSECLKALQGIADFFLVHNREIQNRIDDSLVRVVSERPVFLRRARGYTPESLPSPIPMQGVVACGGVLKSTVAIGREQRCYVSPYIGKMENLETYHSLEQTTSQLLHLLKVKPALFACDLHPGSLSSQFAQVQSKATSLPIEYIQHHHAHAASCMAENNFPADQNALCVVYDGTGYGEDGSIWGGEIFLASYREYKRVAHLSPIPLPGGDMAIKNPWRIAMGMLYSLGYQDTKEIFSQIDAREQDAVWDLLRANVSCPLASSMGRLFDAISAILGINTRMQYEGQPAMELESLASEEEQGFYSYSILQKKESPLLLEGTNILEKVLQERQQKIPVPVISARFHNTIAQATQEMVCQMARSYNISQVFLSGGCFQNALLLQKTISLLEKENLRVYTHRILSPNDEGISYGQAVIAAARRQSR